jgi:hypothetical protein
LEMALHLLGQGEFLDTSVLKLFAVKGDVYEIQTPFWFLLFYIVTSLFAVFHKRLMFAILSLVFIFFMLV